VRQALTGIDQMDSSTGVGDREGRRLQSRRLLHFPIDA
jgi:hypothetical protein